MQVTEARRGSRDVDDAAQIWAEATAARDGEDEVAGLSQSRPIIQAVLDSSPAAFVLLAWAVDGAAAGFVAVEPIAGISHTRAEVRYVGVRPAMCGRGVGERLLTDLRSRLKSADFTSAQLLVYTDNSRALARYERWAGARAASHHCTRAPANRSSATSFSFS